MGLVKTAMDNKPAVEVNEPPSLAALSAALSSPEASVRRHAAQDMAAFPEATPILFGRLTKEGNVAVREAIWTTLVKLNDPSLIDGVIVCLRTGDAALRNEAIETFNELSFDAAPALQSLLSDPDARVRIFAVNILEARRNPDVESLLIEVIERDQHVNVCAAATDLLCEVGTETAVDALLRLKARFPLESYLLFAADLALKRIREP